MKKILSIFLLIFLVNCTTTTPSTNTTPKTPIDNVIDAFKKIPFPTM